MPHFYDFFIVEIDVSQGNIETKFRDHNDLHNPNVISEIIRRYIFLYTFKYCLNMTWNIS